MENTMIPLPHAWSELARVHSGPPMRQLSNNPRMAFKGGAHGGAHTESAVLGQSTLTFASGRLGVVKPVSSSGAASLPSHQHPVESLTDQSDPASASAVERSEHVIATENPIAPQCQQPSHAMTKVNNHSQHVIVVEDSNLDRERVASSEADTTASTAQHSSPRPSKPPSAFVSNPYGSDMPTTDPGQDSMPADADQENDEELLAEEFSSLCDDEEVDDVSTLPDKPKGPPQSMMPTWLMSEYHWLHEQLNEEMSRNSFY
ncbi:hypothetical protein BS17DRAFT_480302 [Gyrodon lividus]|nr:hypothetical protein BS17DRAFT_480302 [Gyrodon lividus]